MKMSRSPQAEWADWLLRMAFENDPEDQYAVTTERQPVAVFTDIGQGPEMADHAGHDKRHGHEEEQ